MPRQARKKYFEMPLKIILTEEGASEFMHNNKKLARIKLADNSVEYGLLLENIGPGSIQRMIMLDYLSKIEVSNIDPMSCRQEIMDLTKLVVHGMTYRQFNSVSFSQMLASDLIKQWNRLNPMMVIDEKTRFKEDFIQRFMRDKNDEITDIRRIVLLPLHNSIAKDKNLQADEKNIKIFLSEKMINVLNPVMWYILVKFKGTREFDILIHEMRKTLIEYMGKAMISEYIALMTMELAVGIANTNIQKEAAALYGEKFDVNRALLDQKIRDKLIGSLLNKDNMVSISWKMGGTSSFIGSRGKFQLTLYDTDSKYREVRDSIEATKLVDTNKQDLSDFYKVLSGAGTPDTDLGIYYLSYLNEACEKAGIKFESLVNQIQDTNLTIIVLSFFI